MNLFELTRRLIDIPSVSGEEREVGRFLASHLGGLGYRVELQEVEAGRANVLATAGEPPRVVLSTHMDTVPPFIPSAEDETHIRGRGACDAKGIIAAQVTAAEALRAEGVTEVGLLFTVDEELGSLGARAANEHPSAARGESAIEKMLDVLADVRAIHWPRDEFFGETTCNIGTLGGGTRPNVIPAEASAELQIRLVTPPAAVKKILEEAAAGRARIEYLSAAEPVRTHAVGGFGREVVRFTTDIPYLPNWGAPLLVGPGSILDAHTDAERVSKRELEEAVGIYARLVRTLLAGKASAERTGE